MIRKNMFRALLGGVLLTYLAACQSPEPFYGVDAYVNWMKRALADPSTSAQAKLFSEAYRGNPAAINGYFDSALAMAMETEVRVEPSEALSFELQTILNKVGDRRFSELLRQRTPEVQSAVKFGMGGVSDKVKYPLTDEIFQNAPKIEFPVMRMINGTDRVEPAPQS